MICISWESLVLKEIKMQINFKTISKVKKDGRVFLLQKGDVHGNVQFWSIWRRVKPEYKNLLSFRKENGRWKAFRLIPPDNPLEPEAFKKTYYIQDKSKLLPYQSVSVEHICNAILNHGAAVDQSDTGTGKTYVNLSVCKNLGFRPGVICKKAGIAGWKEACAYMDIEPVFIVNWEFIKTNRFPFIKKERDEWDGSYTFTWNIPKGTILLFDEAHVANHQDSQNNRIYYSSKGIHSVAISATLADRPQRLFPFLYILGIMSIEDFREYLYSQGYVETNRESAESKTAGFSDHDILKKLNKLLIPGYGYRLSYNDPAVKKYFPKEVKRVKIVSIGERNRQKQNRLYTDLIVKASEYKELGDKVAKASHLVADLRYRQATELIKADVLVDLTGEYLYEGYSVCIFVNYMDTLVHLSKMLRTRSMIFGSQDRYISREKVISDFQKDKERILLCMSQAGGQSISLHDKRGDHPRMSLICPTYDPVVLKQICGRTYRAGCKSTPIIQLVYAAGTVEEKVARRVNEKIANISALNEGDLMDENLFNITKG